MNWPLILIALFLSSISFIILSFLAILFGNWMRVHQDFGLKTIFKSLLLSYFLEFLIPLAIFIMFLYFLPFKGVRFGITFALFIFILNALQISLLSLQGIKLPFNFIVHALFWKLLKYLVSFGIVGFILSF